MNKENIISLDTKIVRNPKLYAVDMDGEKVMLHLEQSRYFNLNDVGSYIWDILESPLMVKELISYLLKEYNIDDKTCEANTLSFLNLLKKKDLIEIV